jgi:hypothetical protein
MENDLLNFEPSRPALTIAKVLLEEIEEKNITVKVLHEKVSKEFRELKYLGNVYLDLEGNVTGVSTQAVSIAFVFKYESLVLSDRLMEVFYNADYSVEIINTV